MASGSPILDALNSMNQKPADTIYGAGATGIAGIAPSLVNPYGSTASNIGGVVGAGLLSALLASFAKDDANTHNAALYPLENQFLQNPDQRASLIAANPDLAPLGAASLSRALDQQDTQQKLLDAIALNKATSAEDLKNKITFATDPSVVDAAVQEAAAKKLAINEGKPIPEAGVQKIATGVTLSKQFQQAIDSTKAFTNVGENIPGIGGIVNSTIGSLARDYQGLYNNTPEGGFGQQVKLLQEMAGKSISGSARWPIVKANLDEVAAGRLGDPAGTAKLLQQTKDLIDQETQDTAAVHGDAGYRKLAELKGNSLLGEVLASAPTPGTNSLAPTSAPTVATQQLKASDLIAQGYKKTAQGWVR